MDKKEIKKDILYFIEDHILRFIPDEPYLKLKYRLKTGKKLNLANPQTFNEKIQWLKIHDRKPLYTTLVDKYEVKKYVANIIGEEYIIPTYGVWNHFDEIDFNKLPDQFVLKCTHDSGGIVIVRDKKSFDRKAAKKKLEKHLKRNFYWGGREWPYKNVKPRIIAEKFLEDKEHIVPEDYKIYCFNGKPKYIVVFHNRFNDGAELSESVYNTKWEKQNFSLDAHFAVSEIKVSKPECLNDVLRVCAALSKGKVQSRIDFYIINNTIYFGEVTLQTASGFQPMIPKEIDEILGKKLRLPRSRGGVSVR